MQTVYPKPGELRTLLESAGIEVNEVLERRLPIILSSAVASFEERTGRKFLATGDAVTRYYAPPDNRDGILFLGKDLGTDPTPVITYQPQGASAETFDENEDYTLYPLNASADGKPYTHIKIYRSSIWTLPYATTLLRSIRVLGKWHYGGVPDDVFEAILEEAAIQAVVGPAMSTSGGVKRKKIEDYEVDYGDGPYRNEIRVWSSFVREVTGRWKKLI